MKKLLFTFCLFSLVFNSCNDNELEDYVDNVTSDSVFLQKKIETYQDEEVVTNYIYDEDKLISLSDSDGYSEVFTYTDDLLTSIQEYEDGELGFQTQLEYDSFGRLVKEIISIDSNTVQVNEFTYNSDGTITMVEDGENTYIFSYDNYGNRVSEVHLEGDNDYSYTYDTRKNPFRNIHQRMVFELIGHDVYNNNVLSYISSSSSNMTDNYNSSYAYNAIGYPTGGTQTYNPGTDNQEIVTLQFIYEL